MAATLIDLAAREYVEVEQRGPGVFYVRLRTGHRSTEALTRYERRVLEHLESVASGGVAPAEALTTGPQDAAESWRRMFEAQVVDDAKARGLSRDAVGGGASLALIALAALPAFSAVALRAYSAALVILAAAYLILNWIVAQHPQRETAAGLEAASRWLGVRAELASNEVFPSYTPLTVPLWDRLLAYGAALGVATGASRPLPMGTESDTHAWSSHGGRWRPVRIRYRGSGRPAGASHPARPSSSASALPSSAASFSTRWAPACSRSPAMAGPASYRASGSRSSAPASSSASPPP